MIGDRFFIFYGNKSVIFGFLRFRWNFWAEKHVLGTLRWGEPGLRPFSSPSDVGILDPPRLTPQRTVRFSFRSDQRIRKKTIFPTVLDRVRVRRKVKVLSFSFRKPQNLEGMRWSEIAFLFSTETKVVFSDSLGFGGIFEPKSMSLGPSVGEYRGSTLIS